MYYTGWISLVIISLWLSVVAFIWALWSGQFSDQTRARYLPFCDDQSLPVIEKPQGRTAESYALIAIVVLGLLALAAPIIMILYRLRG
jgi:cbb3-type cytochrome oxidase maturation protein